MSKRIFITDVKSDQRSQELDLVVYWSRGLKNKNDIDILEYIEKNSIKFKTLYSNFINRIKKKNITINFKKIALDRYLQINNFESCKYTTVEEKCNWGKSFFINEIIKCYAINDIINQHAPDFIKVDLKNQSQETLLLLEDIFKRNKIKYEFVNSKLIEKKIFNKFYFFKFLKSITNYFFLIIKNYRIFNSRSLRWLNFKSKILFISYLNKEDIQNIKQSNNHSSYWGDLSKLLGKKNKISWVYLGASSGSVIDKLNISSLIFKKNYKFKNEMHINLYDFLSLKKIFLSLKIWINLLIRLKKISDLDKVFYDEKNNINNNIYLKKDFIQSFYSIEMIHNILIYLLFNDLFKKTSFKKKCFYLFERAPWEASLLKNFRKFKHGHIFAVGHSTISKWDLRYSLNNSQKRLLKNHNEPDYFIANSFDMKQKIIDLKYSQNKIILAEALRYKYLNKIKIKKDLKFRKSLTLLVILDINTVTALNQLMYVEKLIKDFKNLEIIIKVHPTSNIKNFLDDNMKKKCSLEKLSNLFNKCHVVFTSNITSANFEAVHLNLPVLCFNDPNTLNLSPILDPKLINFFNNYSELREIIEKKKYLKKRNNSKKLIFNLKNKKNFWEKLVS